MNANELADELDGFLKEQEQLPWGTKQVYLDQASTMLRQQQAEIEAFKQTIVLATDQHKRLSKMLETSLTLNKVLNDRIDRMIENASHHEGIAHAGGFEAGWQSAQAEIEALKKQCSDIHENGAQVIDRCDKKIEELIGELNDLQVRYDKLWDEAKELTK